MNKYKTKNLRIIIKEIVYSNTGKLRTSKYKGSLASHIWKIPIYYLMSLQGAGPCW
jgi:hypothetical protein